MVQRAHRQKNPVGVACVVKRPGIRHPPFCSLAWVDSLNMTPSSLPRIKWTIRSFTIQLARGLAGKALKIDNEADTHRLLNRALKVAGLNALVREN